MADIEGLLSQSDQVFTLSPFCEKPLFVLPVSKLNYTVVGEAQTSPWCPHVTTVTSPCGAQGPTGAAAGAGVADPPLLLVLHRATGVVS